MKKNDVRVRQRLPQIRLTVRSSVPKAMRKELPPRIGSRGISSLANTVISSMVSILKLGMKG